MADATLQILGLGSGAVPLGYDVTGSQDLDLIAVTADFDGTAAAVAYVPMVEIVSPAGEVMAQAKAPSVAAGASATVTFAPFLDEPASTSTGGITATNARYSGDTLSINANTTASLSLSGPGFGPALLDLTTPTAPTIVTAGVYAFCFVARIVIALGGTPTAGSAHAAAINNAGGGQNCTAFLTWKTAAGSIVPQWTATSIPAHHAAGDAITFRVTNADAASARTYDSPSIAVVLLT